MTEEEKQKWGRLNVAEKLQNRPITCGSCQEVFKLNEGDMVTTFLNDANRFQTSCPKCHKGVDFVIVYYKDQSIKN